MSVGPIRSPRRELTRSIEERFVTEFALSLAEGFEMTAAERCSR